jgi:hypothetical protein
LSRLERARALHVIRNLDAEDSGRALQLAPEEVRHPQQENAFLAVLFVNDGVLLVEIAEGLRELLGRL